MQSPAIIERSLYSQASEIGGKVLFYQAISEEIREMYAIDPVVNAYALVQATFNGKVKILPFVNVSGDRNLGSHWQHDLPYGGLVVMVFSMERGLHKEAKKLAQNKKQLQPGQKKLPPASGIITIEVQK